MNQYLNLVRCHSLVNNEQVVLEVAQALQLSKESVGNAGLTVRLHSCERY